MEFPYTYWEQSRASRTNVMTPDGETEKFDVLAGVLQRDTGTIYFYHITWLCSKTDECGERKEDWVHNITQKIKTNTAFGHHRLGLGRWHMAAEQWNRAGVTSPGRSGSGMCQSWTRSNAKKTESGSHSYLSTRSSEQLREVQDFKYLEFRMQSTEEDIKIRGISSEIIERNGQYLEIYYVKWGKNKLFPINSRVSTSVWVQSVDIDTLSREIC